MTAKQHTDPSLTQIVVLCGGPPGEHEVSLESTKSVLAALDKQRYRVKVIFITQTGKWLLLDSVRTVLGNPAMQTLVPPFSAKPVVCQPGNNPALQVLIKGELYPIAADVILPVVHGIIVEDGSLQGFLDLLNMPYVGSGVLGSALCMDKDMTKRVLKQAGISVAKWLTVHQEDWESYPFDKIAAYLGLPFFIKPVCTGSSVGISCVTAEDTFEAAKALAHQYHHKVILEARVPGREIECAVLGNCQTRAALPAEIIPQDSFYSYRAKYIDAKGATLITPCDLKPTIIREIQTLAKKAFALLCCDGMARVDFFLTPNEQTILNEVNTIPGFTTISQYPKMWATSGVPYHHLLDELIVLAKARFTRDRAGYCSQGESN